MRRRSKTGTPLLHFFLEKLAVFDVLQVIWNLPDFVHAGQNEGKSICTTKIDMVVSRPVLIKQPIGT